MDDVLGYEGKHVVVTGAASGMGEQVARICHELGANVTALDLKPVSTPVKTSLTLDLLDQGSIDGVVAEIEGPIDSVFSCAGLPGPPFADLDVLLVNFIGARHLIEQLVPRMPEGAAIASIASNAGLGWQQQVATLMPFIVTDGFDAGKAWCEAHPEAFAGNAYSFSKQLINAWVGWRAATLIKQGIRLNNINPGPTATPMMPYFEEIAGKELVHAFVGPIGRDSQPEEQAWPLVLLNSFRMGYVTGEALHTDGGFLGAVQTGQIDVASLLPS